MRLSLLLALVMGLMSCSDDGMEVAAPIQQPPADLPPVQAPPAGQPVTTIPTDITDTGPWVLQPTRGQALFAEKCQHCHGASGAGGYGPALTSAATCPPCQEFTMLWKRIDEFMPLRNPEACDAQCSRDIAAWISNGFSIAPSCSVEFRYDSIEARQFMATVRIVNHRGLDVPVWRLAFSMPVGHAVTSVRNASGSVVGDQVLLSPLASTSVIRHGAALEVGLEGTHAGSAIIPGDLRLEASPCFTIAPGTA